MSDEPELAAAAAMHAENVEAVQRILISKSIMQEQPFEVTLRITRDGITTSVRSAPARLRRSTRVPEWCVGTAAHVRDLLL